MEIKSQTSQMRETEAEAEADSMTTHMEDKLS